MKKISPPHIIQIVNKSTSAGQVEQPVSVIHPVIEEIGKLKEHSIVTKQKDHLIDEYNYPFNGSTKLWFKYILGNATVKIYLYPN